MEFRHQNPEFVEHSDHDGNQPVAEQSIEDYVGSDQEYDGGTASEVSDHSNDSEASDEILQFPPPVVARSVARRRNLSLHQVQRSSRKTNFQINIRIMHQYVTARARVGSKD